MMPLCMIYLTISLGGDLYSATVSDLSDYFCRWRYVGCHCVWFIWLFLEVEICTLPLCLIYLTNSRGGDLYAAIVSDLSDYFCRWRSVRCHCVWFICLILEVEICTLPLCLIYLTISLGGDLYAPTVSDYLTISLGGDLYAATVSDLSDYFFRWRSVRCHCVWFIWLFL